jgi:hypothetical protein
LTAKVLVQGHATPSVRTLAFCRIIGCRGNVRTVGKYYVACSAGASMSAFEIRPERPPSSQFYLEVYIFALFPLEEVINKRPLWLLERNKNVGSRCVCRTVEHTTSGTAPSQETGASRNLFEKVYRRQKMIDERAGDERSWKYIFLEMYILFRKSIYIFKKVYLRNPAHTRCKSD